MKWSKCWKLPPFPWLEESRTDSRLRFDYGNGLCCADLEAGCAAFGLGGHTNTSCLQFRDFCRSWKKITPSKATEAPPGDGQVLTQKTHPEGFFTAKPLWQKLACPSLRSHEALVPGEMEVNVQVEIFTMFVFPLQPSGNGKKIQGVFTRLPSLEGSHIL